MSALVRISTDLELRYGTTVFNFRRFLDTRENVLLENEETGEPWKLSTAQLCRMLQSKELIPVGGSQPVPMLQGESAQDVILDIDSLPTRQKVLLLLRYGLIKMLKKAGVSRGQTQAIADRLPEMLPKLVAMLEKAKLPANQVRFEPGVSTVQRYWTRLDYAGGNYAALASGHWFRRPGHLLDPQVDDCIDDLLDKFYLQPNRPTLKETCEKINKRLKALAEQGKISEDLAQVSEATVQRRKQELDPFLVTMRREGIARARREHRYTLDGTCVTRALQRLEVDHTLLDWYVLCDVTGLPLGRPTLTIVVDSFSKHITGLYVSFNGPSIATVLKAIKNSILPKTEFAAAAGLQRPWIAFGVGETFLLDNGLEFHCAVMQRVSMELGIDVEFCPVRSPWVKPNVERAFAELDYISVSQGRVDKRGSDAIPKDPKSCAVIPFSRFAKGLVIWASDIHGQRVNRRTLCRPAEIFEESLALAPAPSMPLTFEGLDLIAAMSLHRKVGLGGVERRGITWAGPELKEVLADAGGPFRGLIKWDPDNLDVAYVQNPRSFRWHALQSTRPDFTVGLTEHQLRVIRSAMWGKAKARDRVDEMIQARDNLREAWLEPLAVRDVKVDPVYARKFAAVSATATRVDRPAPPAATVLSPDELGVYEPQDVPAFEVETF